LKITDMKVHEHIEAEKAWINPKAAMKLLKLLNYEKALKNASVKTALRHAGKE